MQLRRGAMSLCAFMALAFGMWLGLGREGAEAQRCQCHSCPTAQQDARGCCPAAACEEAATSPDASCPAENPR